MDCTSIDFSSLGPEDIFGLIATCGPSIITAWRTAIETDPNAAPPITPEVELELRRLEQEAQLERERLQAAKLSGPAAIFGAVLLLRRR